MEMNISPIHKFQYNLKKDFIELDKKENLLNFISYEVFIFVLIAFVSFNIAGSIESHDWFLLVANSAVLILDIVLVFYFLRAYQSNKKKFDLKLRLLDELYSGKYEDILDECDDLETKLCLLERETSKKITQAIGENDEKVNLHSIIRW